MMRIYKVKEETPVEAPSTLDPDSSIQEWRSEVTKRSSVSWEEKPEKVNLYSENVIQETENTETVDRESISDLNSIRQQWETKFKTEQTPEKSAPKPKPPQQVRHWEVKLPTQLKKVPADVVRTTRSDSDSETETMADTEMSAESAIEREIRLATEREDLLRKEQEERAKLQAKQMAAAKKEPFETSDVEQNNNKPTFHEMTEADRGSELRQREDRIQQEILEQQEREAAMRGQHEDSSSSSGEDDDNNESIIEREIRLQRERELELELRHQKHNARQVQDEKKDVVEETVEISYLEPAHVAPTTLRTPEQLSETDEAMTDVPQSRMRISYEEAISSGAHEGESLIARELREAREREEDLNKQRERVATGTTQGPKSADMSPQPREMENKSENQKPSYSKDVSPFKNGRSQSTDSLSSGNSSEKPQPVTPRITSFSSGGKIGGLNYSVPEKPKDAKRQETPIEREIRLARERESEYRVSKGLPPLEDVKKDDYELDDDEKDMIVVRSSNQSARAAGKDNIQRFASTRLQKEIDKQTAMEKQYLNEGKIKSTSEEHVGLVKYSEIAQDFSTTPKRNFSINKKGGSGNEPVTEHNGTTPDHKSSPKNSTPDQNVPKYNRSTSSGGVTFSYRESRHKAESKIEKELREMREREEELRSRRAVGGVVSPSSPRSPATSVVDKRSAFEQTS